MKVGRVDAEVDGAILVVSLDHPDARNAMTVEMARELAQRMDLLDDSAELRVAVLHGRHGTFCSGMDLKRFRATGSRPLDERRGSGGLTWRPPRKPVIAAVEGFALGLGFEMVLACDLVVAASDARLGLPEVRHGLVAAGGGAIRLASRIPRTAAMEILLTGRMTSAGRLHELGLVNQVCRPGHAKDRAVDLAREIAEHPAEAVDLTKEIVDRSRTWPEAEAFAEQEPLIADLLRSRSEPA